MKINLFNKKIIQSFYAILSFFSVITSLLFIFIDIPQKCKYSIGFIASIILIIIYLIIWLVSNKLSRLHISISSSPVEIKFGDIFEEDGLKVISFNEFFDVKVDEKLIASTTLNGYYVTHKISNIDEFNQTLESDVRLSERILDNNCNRKDGKKIKYRLGSIFVHNEYLLTAFTHFDQDNRAYLNIQDYVNFLLEFWNELDILYAGRTVVIPLLGSGITRFKETTISDQELLELLLWSFKTSRIQFRYPAKIKIILSKSKKDKISLFKLKEFQD